MDERQREDERSVRELMKYNELQILSRKEGRTTAEISQIGANLEDGTYAHCSAQLWPHIDLFITLVFRASMRYILIPPLLK